MVFLRRCARSLRQGATCAGLRRCCGDTDSGRSEKAERCQKRQVAQDKLLHSLECKHRDSERQSMPLSQTDRKATIVITEGIRATVNRNRCLKHQIYVAIGYSSKEGIDESG